MQFHQVSREHHAIEFDSNTCFESSILIKLHESHTFNTPFPQKKREEGEKCCCSMKPLITRCSEEIYTHTYLTVLTTIACCTCARVPIF